MPLRHHSLVAWQRADDLFIKLHQLTLQAFPAYERFEPGSQLRRAAYSVPANIVEGFARRYRRARLHFLNISEGSLAEVGYCVHAAKRLGYISDGTCEELELEIRKVAAPLSGLVRSAHLLPTALSMLGGGVVGAALTILLQRFLP
jgi:four helix bundle protein